MRKLLIMLLAATFSMAATKMYAQSTTTGVQKENVYDIVEKMPEYPGGVGEMIKFLSSNIKYPEEARKKGLQGRVIVKFIVKKDGTITDTEVAQSCGKLLDNEALRVVRLMPKWTPGEIKGRKVDVRYALPVVFRL